VEGWDRIGVGGGVDARKWGGGGCRTLEECLVGCRGDLESSLLDVGGRGGWGKG